jgi:hypothetical protein
MKSIIIALILITSGFKEQKIDYVAFEYDGAIDKPMPVVFITKTHISITKDMLTMPQSENSLDDIVDRRDFDIVKQIIYSSKKEKFAHQQYDDDGFKITIHDGSSKKAYFVSRKKAVLLFKEIIKKLGKHAKRVSDLKILILRNDF